MTLGKMIVGGGPPIFDHLKRALELFTSVRMSPFAKILRPLGRYDHPWEKKLGFLKFHLLFSRVAPDYSSLPRTV